MATRRRATKEENANEVRKLISAKETTGLIVHSADGRLFFLSEKDARRTKVPAKHGRTVRKVLAMQNRRQGGHPPVAGPLGLWQGV